MLCTEESTADGKTYGRYRGKKAHREDLLCEALSCVAILRAVVERRARGTREIGVTTEMTLWTKSNKNTTTLVAKSLNHSWARVHGNKEAL